MSLKYFTKQARGGIIASNINFQDIIATNLGVQLLAKKSKYWNPRNYNWHIMCEGEDDLEIHIENKQRVYIQVKNQQVTESTLKSIIKGFKSKLDILPNIDLHFHIALLKGLSNTITEIKSHMDELKNSEKVYTKNEYQNKVTELSSKYNIPKEVLIKLSIEEYSFCKNETQSIANFSYFMRQTFPIRDFADSFLQGIYKDLIYQFSNARRERKSIHKKEFIEPIEKLIKYEIGNANYLEYEKKEKGYFQNKIFLQKMNNEGEIVHKAYSRIKRSWFKHYWLKIIIPFVPYEECKNCKHPLMGNIMGLNGLSCPKCRYFPFITLIVICDCSHYIIIKKQPELKPEKILEYINDYIRTENCRCSKCNKDLSKVTIETRAICVPFPLPMEDYKFGKMTDYLNIYN